MVENYDMQGKGMSGIEKGEKDPGLRYNQQGRCKIKLPDYTATHRTSSL
jgi:hypothetical protein